MMRARRFGLLLLLVTIALSSLGRSVVAQEGPAPIEERVRAERKSDDESEKPRRGERRRGRDRRARFHEAISRLSPEDRRNLLERLKGMSNDERRAFFREQKRRLDALPDEKREALEKRHQKLMRWRIGLNPQERRELRKLPPEERRAALEAKIAELRSEYRDQLAGAERSEFDALPAESQNRAILRHLKAESMRRFRDRHVATLTPEERAEFEALSEEEKHERLRHWRMVRRFAHRLPASEREAFLKLGDEEQRARIRERFPHLRDRDRPRRGGDRPGRDGSRRGELRGRLLHYLESLTAAEREALRAWRPGDPAPLTEDRLPPAIRELDEAERGEWLRLLKRAASRGERDRPGRPPHRRPPGPRER